MDDDVATAYAAIQAFYGGTGQTAQAGEWLTQFQRTPKAWQVCDRMLTERRDSVSMCFASQTIRQKILKNLAELPVESLPSLRESLTEHLSHIHLSLHDQASDVTATQLCLALADLYIQVNDWTDLFAQLLARFNSMDGDRTRMLLVLLRVFPEELDTVPIGENRRRVVREEIAANTEHVLAFLSYVMENPVDEDLVKKAVSCLAAALSNSAMPTNCLAESPLLTTVFTMLTSPVSSSLHSVATDCIVNALYRAEDWNAHGPLALAVHRGVRTLVEPFKQAVAAEDYDRMQNFGRIFVEMAESFLELLVNGGNSPLTNELASLETLDILLLMAEQHDYSLIEMTFNSWYRISEGLFMIDSEDYIANYKLYITRYLRCIYNHCRLDNDHEGLLDPKGDVFELRLKASESVKDVVYIIQTDECIRMMYQMLTPTSQWEDMEAALFIIAQVVHNLLPDEQSCVPELIRSVVSLPRSSHDALLYTSIEMLGGCSEWLSKHEEYYEIILPWLCELAKDSKMATVAGEAIENVCRKAQSPLTQFIPSLLSLIPLLESSSSHAPGVEGGISHLLRAATVLVMSLPEGEIGPRMEEICRPVASGFLRALSSPAVPDENSASWAKISHEPVLWIDRIASVFREVRPWTQQNVERPAPWLPIALYLWNPLSQTWKRLKSNGRVIEHVCRAIRFLVRSLGVQSRPFIEPLVSEMMEIYTEHPHSCLLYLASILVDEYGAITDVQPGLFQMLDTLARRSFVELQKENGIRDNPDMVDDLFRLGLRFVTRCTSPFFRSEMSGALFECGLASISIDHQDAHQSVCRFFLETIEQMIVAKKMSFAGEGVAELSSLLSRMGGRLVERTLSAALFDVSSHLRRDLAELLMMIMKLDRDQLGVWLEGALAQLPSTPPCATPEQVTVFHSQVMRETDSRGIHNQIRDFIKLYS